MAGTAQSTADHGWLREAVELARRCPPSDSAFSVGAILVGADGTVIATGYSRELDPRDHAEEVALAKAGALPGSDRPGPAAQPGLAAPGGALAGATMYSSLEPCCRRLSRPRSCAELIAAAGIGRVVLAWREPPVFVPGGGAQWLREHGVTVAEMPGLADAARAPNVHLLGG
ncbi:MAG TPA: dCMP deaminase [Streptosporangiaceae bacterium]|nr:dCMP deaminase [Streptosporangiaceae bacterium]